MQVSRRIRRRRVVRIVSAGFAGLTAGAIATPMQAQQPIALPPIVVQGATLERQPVAPPRSEPAPAATAAAPSAPAPAPAADTDATGETVAGQPIATVGTAVTVVTGPELRAAQVRHVADALRSLPGVQVAGNGSIGSFTQVRIRGAEGKHTRVIVDGIEVNTTKDGEFDFSNLAAEEIERIEVIRGPMSSLYGSGAIGGVINISTRGGQGPLTLGLRTEYGSFGTKDVAARLSAGNDKAYFAIAGQWRDIRGFNIAPVGTEVDGTRLNSFGFRAGAKITDNAQIDVVLRNWEKRAEYDGFGGTARLSTAIDQANVLRDSNWLMGGTLRWDTFNKALTHEFKLNQATSSSRNTEPGRLATDDSQRTTYGYAATWRLATPAIWATHAFTGQLEKQIETYTPFSNDGFGFNGDGVTHARERSSRAGEWRGTFGRQLTLTAGLRRDDNTTFQDFTTWRTSASWSIPGIGLRPHASLGTAVKLPGLYDQFGLNIGNFVSNPDLRPESSKGWDAGIEATLLGGKAVVDVTYFNANLIDKISVDYFNFPYRPVNLAGTSTREGVEVAARLQAGPALSFGAAYTYTDARRPDGLAEFRRAPHSGRIDARLLFAAGRGTATLAAAYNGRAPDIAFPSNFDPAERVTLRDYWLVTAAASFKLQPNVEIFGRLENLLNQKYQEVYGYNTAPAAAYIGLKINLQDAAVAQ